MALRAGQAAIVSQPRRRSKYNAIRTTVDGITFDSKKEATYFSLLRLRERVGAIRGLERQPVFELHAPSGEVIGRYRGDFRYQELIKGRWQSCTVDVKSKGTRTALYKWKKKHVEAEHGIQIHEV